MSGKALLRAALLLALIACVPGGWIILGVVVLWDAASDQGGTRALRRRTRGRQGAPPEPHPGPPSRAP